MNSEDIADVSVQQLAGLFFQAFADSRGCGTRYGPVHLLTKESDSALCGVRSKRWNYEGETEADFCSRCLKQAVRRVTD